MKGDYVESVKQQRGMAKEMGLPAKVQLDLLRKEREVGTARVGCKYYKYDPMLNIECPEGFCYYKLEVHRQPFGGCDFMDNPEACPYSRLEVPKKSKWQLMGGRVSVIKRPFVAKRFWRKEFLGDITFSEFLNFSKQFCEAFESTYQGESDITVTLYKAIPHYVTTIGLPGEMEWVRQRNEERKIATLHSLEDLTKEQFRSAIYIGLRIAPKDEENAPKYACGWVSCKGRLPRHILFQAQPDEVASTVWQRIFDQNGAPPNLKYGLGDGFEENVFLSLH